MSANTANKKIIKPLTPTEFEADSVKYSNVKINSEIKTKWVDTSYSRGSNEEKFLVVARGCVVKTFKKMDKPKDAKDDGKPRKDKFQIFMGLHDEAFIEMVKNYETALIHAGVENSEAWLNDKFNEEECKDMLKPIMSHHEKYGYAIGGVLGREFTCKSKTEAVPDVSDLMVALAKNTIVDVCFWFNKVKMGAGKYNIGIEITQINITGISSGGNFESPALNPDDYEAGKIALGEVQQHDKGGKFCKVNYGDNAFRVRLTNIVGRIFKFEKEGVSFSMSVRLSPNSSLRKMIEGVDSEVFKLLVDNSKDYYGSKKNAKVLRGVVKNMYSYNKTDQEKVSKGEKPTYDPSVWIKIYHSDEKGFDGKITNAETGKPIENVDELLNKDLNIASIEFYSRHVWFGPKGTTINLTLNKCSITYESTEYDMDAAEEDADSTKDGEEVVEDAEAVNSDDE
jgi:hypothetical protein